MRALTSRARVTAGNVAVVPDLQVALEDLTFREGAPRCALSLFPFAVIGAAFPLSP